MKFKSIWILFVYVATTNTQLIKHEKNNIEYHPSNGRLHVILGVTHGGQRTPSEIPDRDAGCLVNETCVWSHTCSVKNYQKCYATREPDINVVKLATLVRDNLCKIFNSSCPALVVNLLHRSKFDANRDLGEATFHVPLAVDAFYSFHDFIGKEINKFDETIGGLLLDIHGHGHQKQWTELGYMVKSDELEGSVETFYEKSSIRRLLQKYINQEQSMENVFRGNESFGGYLQKHGYQAVPSPEFKSPQGLPYFYGHYSTKRYGSSQMNGKSDAIMVEICRSVRNDEQIQAYSCALALTVRDFMCTHYYSKDIESKEGYDHLLKICREDLNKNIC